MARYSREQRRRAVELYERYEHSAADVIRELGYPSKGALLMWYREWLEERRTGVPSRRGERYARYTDGQRRAAVEHCLTHGRRSGRTMRRMGYCLCSMFFRRWGVVTFCWTPVSLFFDYAMSPSSRLRFAMLVPKVSLIRSSRYQVMYASSCSMNPLMVTPAKSWTSSSNV